MNNLKILIIQNTSYHFETTISLYASIKRLNPKKVDIIQLRSNWTQQEEFLKQYNISYINKLSNLRFSYDMAFVISAYPNPHVKINDSIPEINNPLFNFYKDRIIYVSHRFDKIEDYLNHPTININNTICLSPISSRIGIDYIYPIEYPVAPKIFEENYSVFTIQGHFELVNRILDNNNIFNCSNQFDLNFLGTNIPTINLCENHKYYPNLNEINFYQILNNSKFLFPMIDDKIKNGTYINQRFSSNFNHAMALEKPIFAHKIFKDIYGIPGIYYNDDNINEQFNDILNISKSKYNELIENFKIVKEKYYLHNNYFLTKKINTIHV